MNKQIADDLLTIQIAEPGSDEILNAIERLLDEEEDQRVDLLLEINSEYEKATKTRGWLGAKSYGYIRKDLRTTSRWKYVARESYDRFPYGK